MLTPVCTPRRLCLWLSSIVIILSAYSASAYNWVGDAYGGGKRAIVKAYLKNPPSHPTYEGYAHISANTEVHPSGGWLLKSYYSVDDGVTWYWLGDMAWESDANSHIGTAHFAQNGTNSTIYAAIEHHTKPNDPNPANRIYRAEVLRSSDYGKTWVFDSTVAATANTTYGYWAPFLFFRPGDNQLQCYFDDEVYPSTVSRAGEQCVRKMNYTASTKTWGSPLTVAFQTGFSRDGMPSVVCTSGSASTAKLLCVFEAPQNAPPANPSRVCKVSSSNGGGTWGTRAVVYAPTNTAYHALCPFITRDWLGKVAVVFSTDEDRYPTPPGNNWDPSTLHTDVKCVTSTTTNATAWTAPTYVAQYGTYGSINLLWPGIAPGRNAADARLVCQFERYGTDYRLRHGY